jgi:two-component system LytT family sensor kinase
VPLPPRGRLWMLTSAVWLVPAALATIDRIMQRRLHGEPPASARELLWAGGDWLVYAFLTPIIFWVSHRWPIARPHLARRGALHLALSLVFGIAWATLGTALQLVLRAIFDPTGLRTAIAAANGHYWSNVGRDLASWIFTTFPFGVVVYLAVAGMAHAIRYFVEARDRDVQMARLSEQLSTARFSALQAQLNPHFLFNALNTIAVHARDGDGAGTARMVEQLSDVLRRTLSRQLANEVTLGDELDLVRQYLALEQARFSDRLRPELAIDETVLAAAVPSFALQHLVENAVRHGIARRSDAGRLQIVARRDDDSLSIAVIDDGPGIAPEAAHTAGHGLENTRERLRGLYGDLASLTVVRHPDGGTTSTLRVPYREMESDSNAR